MIIKIPKKGSLSDWNNWHGITLLSVPSKIFCKVIIQRITQAVDDILRNEQAGFRKGRGCTDQIFTLRNILEQCTEWNRQLYVNFNDYEGCVMPSVLFNIAIDWVLRRTVEDQRRGIRWTPFSTLEDLDFADDLALLSHTWQHIQEKTDWLSIFSNHVGLTIGLKKTGAMCVKVPSPTEIRVRGQGIQYTDKFTYLGSVLCRDGGTVVDIRNRLNKARNAFMSLRSVWRSAKKAQRRS